MNSVSTKRLKAFPLFDEVAEEDLRLLAKHLQILKPEPGDYIIHEGKHPNRVFFIESGQMDVFKQIGHRLVRIDTLSSGDYFGEIGIILNSPATATVRAREGANLLALEKEEFRRFIQRHRVVFFKLFKTATERLSSTNILQLRHLIDELGFFYSKFLDVQKIWYFLPVDLVASTLRGELQLVKAGKLEKVTVLFLDLRHYTFFAEIHQPKEVLSVLNELLGRMPDIVIRNNGVVYKFLGDGLMAIFGSEEDPARNAKNSLKASIEAIRFLKNYNRKRSRKLEEEFYMGIGLCSGEVVTGNIGVENMMMNFTSLGDTVNVAARLCTSIPNNSIAMADSTYKLVYRSLKGMKVVELGNIELRGRREPVFVYQVFDV